MAWVVADGISTPQRTEDLALTREQDMPTGRAMKEHWLALIIAIGMWPQHAHAQANRCTVHKGEDGSTPGRACAVILPWRG